MIDVTWTKHLQGDRKAELTEVVLNSTVVLGRLKQIIREFEAEVAGQEVSIKDYDTPSWAAKQAHRNGMKQAYKKLAGLVNFIKE